VRGAITSPTFVIARSHASLGAGADLIHVDAYRLDSVAEVDDLDLEASMDSSVTVVEWGREKAEGLGDRPIHVVLERDCEPRRVTVSFPDERSLPAH
jgi:tRNA threonylcarbamoyladenosine biosynthesis protein TsaE